MVTEKKKVYMKKHYEENKEAKQEYGRQYSKEYYKKNKDTVSQKIVCDKCGFSYTKNNKTNHMKTKKHQEAINVNKLDNLNIDLNKLDELSDLINNLKKLKEDKDTS